MIDSAHFSAYREDDPNYGPTHLRLVEDHEPQSPFPTEQEIINATIEDHLTPSVYPTHSFSIRAASIVQKADYGAGYYLSYEQQLRGVWNALGREAPESVINPEVWSSKKSLDSIRRYLAGNVKLDGEFYPRQVVLPPDTLISSLETHLHWQNDPVAQVIDQLRREYEGRITPENLYIIRTDTLLSTKRPLIREIYEDYFGRLRAWAKAIS